MSTEQREVPVLRAVGAIRVSTTGILPTDAAAVIGEHLEPILGPWAAHSRVRLTRLPEPGIVRPLIAQIDVQLDAGHRVRAQVAAATMSEVVGLLATRTIEQMQQYPAALAARLRQRVATAPAPSPPELLPPPVRRVTRRKFCRPAAMTAAEAIAELEALDYRFHLFRERFSGQDSIVIRTGPARYRIVQSRPNPIGLEVASPPIVLAAAERLSLAAAIAHLDLTGAPVKIFTDKLTGRLHALYARYDGHYGLMAPPEPSGELIGPDDRRRTGCAT